MRELLLAVEPVKKATVVPLFLYDPTTNTDISGVNSVTATFSGGAAVSSAVKIDGSSTILFNADASLAALVFGKTIDLSAIDWTLEWSILPTTASTSYRAVLEAVSNPYANSTTFVSRFNDGGFGSRLLMGTNQVATSDATTIDVTMAQVNNTIARFAIVCKAGQISSYFNGKRMPFHVGTSAASGGPFDTASIANKSDFSKLNGFNLGYRNSSVPSFRGNMGRIRLAKGALYSGNYTPVAF